MSAYWAPWDMDTPMAGQLALGSASYQEQRTQHSVHMFHFSLQREAHIRTSRLAPESVGTSVYAQGKASSRQEPCLLGRYRETAEGQVPGGARPSAGQHPPQANPRRAVTQDVEGRRPRGFVTEETHPGACPRPITTQMPQLDESGKQATKTAVPNLPLPGETGAQ